MLVKFVTVYTGTKQCFKQKFQRWEPEIFRKRTGNGASTENVLKGILSKSFVIYAVRSVKAS